MQHLAERGFGYGTGHLDSDCSRFLVSIPKNASSYLLSWARQNGWFADQASDFNQCIQEIIVVLRDPEERWISGFAQYVSGNILHAKGFYSTNTGPGKNFQYMSAQKFIEDYNPLTERLIFDNLELFDDHVWPQQTFFKELLPTVPRKYFYISDDLDKQLQEYLGFKNPNQDLDRNDSNNDLDKKIIKQFIRDRLNQITELRAMIAKSYAADYQLIEQIKHDSR
jgi:hypothetical protein